MRLRGRSDERGSVLVLVPAGFLVLILLGGIAVDSAAALLGQRQLANATAGAANDAATAALGNAAFYGSGALVIDPSAAAVVVCRALRSQADSDLHALTVSLAVAGPAIRVRARAEVNGVFGRVVRGFARRTVSAEATAVAAGTGGAATTQPGALVPVACPAG